MAFFDELGKKISHTGQEAVKQTIIMANVAKYNSTISAEEGKLSELYGLLGRKYYEQHKGDEILEYSELMEQIARIIEGIEVLRAKVQEEKGVVVCASCGSEVSINSAFCSVCGSKVEINRSVEDCNASLLACPHCGKEVSNDCTFCTFCGSKIERDVEE